MGKAIAVLGGVEHAREWLRSPQFGLGGAVPLDYAQTEPGAREVENLLGSIPDSKILVSSFLISVPGLASPQDPACRFARKLAAATAISADPAGRRHLGATKTIGRFGSPQHHHSRGIELPVESRASRLPEKSQSRSHSTLLTRQAQVF